MFEKEASVYYVDFDGNLKQGLIKSFEYNKKYVWIKLNEFVSTRIETERIGLSKEEAYEKFEKWKVEYRNQLLQGENWLKELFEAWHFSGDDVAPREMVKIMLDVIKEKTNINIEE